MLRPSTLGHLGHFTQWLGTFAKPDANHFNGLRLSFGTFLVLGWDILGFLNQCSRALATISSSADGLAITGAIHAFA
jgi:hypothetical protein